MMDVPGWLEKIIMRGIAEKHVHISLVDEESNNHGLLWVRGSGTMSGRSIRVPFRIDQIWQLKHGMNFYTVKRLKRQLTRMGVDATHIELIGKERRYCYCTETCREIFGEYTYADKKARQVNVN